MSQIGRTAFAAFLLVGCASTALAEDKWGPQVELEGSFGTTGRNIFQPKMFAPLAQDENSLIYTDFRAKFDDEGSQEANVGLGYRTITSNNWIVGGYGFLDVMNSESGNTFKQVTLGAEAMSEDWDVRANVYIPEGRKEGAASGTLVISGSSIGISGGFERALPGVDAEVGYKLPFDGADLRVYGGGYHYEASGFGNVSGPRVRTELTLNKSHIDLLSRGQELTLGAEYQTDNVRDDQGYVSVKWRVPLGTSARKPSQLTALERRMTKFPERDVDIVTNAGGGTENVMIDGVEVNNLNLQDANTFFSTVFPSAPENTLFVLDGSAGAILVLSDMTMNANQVVLGAGAPVTLRGAQSGAQVTHTFAGTRPTLFSIGGLGDMITLNNNTAVRGINISNPGARGITANTHSNLSIADVDITGSAVGVRFVGPTSNVTIDDVVLAGVVGGTGVSFESGGSATNVTISRLNMSQRNFGLVFNGDSSNVTVTDSVFSNIGTTAVSTNMSSDNQSFTISGITVNTTGDDAFDLGGLTNSVVRDVTITGAGDDGFSLYENTNLLMRDITISNSDYGIYSSSNNSFLTLDNITTNNIGFNSLILTSADNLVVRNSTLNNTGTGEVIYLSNSNNVLIENNELGGTANYAFEYGLGATNITNLSGSGNVLAGTFGSGTCNNGGSGSITGSISFTNGTTCP